MDNGENIGGVASHRTSVEKERENMRLLILLVIALILSGCGNHHTPPPDSSLSNPDTVIRSLHAQLANWHGTPYRYDGSTHKGVDCSAFVMVTFREQFEMQLPRDTEHLAKTGTQIDRADLLPGDLVFFKTGNDGSELHVGIYESDNYFIHASTSKGVIRSSLNNVYWLEHFWQARRI